jgi:acyl-[acyl-carrier-protein]-phospholipid O-acyltransferase / long-chain-fatty-acid--[acyl-carrier-protein] ligase
MNSGIVVALGLGLLGGVVYMCLLAPDRVIRAVLWVVTSLLFRIRVEGREYIPSSGGALLIANHVSFADSVLVGYCTPRIPRFLMWRPYFEVPVFRHFFKALHAIPIGIDSPKNTVRALQQAREALRGGHLVAIFPEGGVTNTGEMGPFERGFERVLVGTNAPIIPMHIDGMYGHPLSTKGGGVLKSWETFWRTRVTVRIGKPIYEPIERDALRLRISGLVERPMEEPAAAIAS